MYIDSRICIPADAAIALKHREMDGAVVLFFVPEHTPRGPQAPELWVEVTQRAAAADSAGS
jgi:hypothetical protein